MRPLIITLVMGSAVAGFAQEAPPGAPPPSAQPSPMVTPQAPTVTLMAAPRSLSPETVTRWRGARALQVSGGVIGLLGSGLSLASTIYIIATGYPPKADDFLHPAKPTDTGPILAYVASGTSVLGFGLSAAGLGWQHRILGELGADPGRGIFVGGTAIGILGTLSTATGYFISLTDYLNPHDQSITVLVTTLTGAALCLTAAALYAKDSSRMKKAWRDLSSF